MTRVMSDRRRRQRCVTCKPSEWKMIRARAKTAGHGHLGLHPVAGSRWGIPGRTAAPRGGLSYGPDRSRATAAAGTPGADCRRTAAGSWTNPSSRAPEPPCARPWHSWCCHRTQANPKPRTGLRPNHSVRERNDRNPVPDPSPSNRSAPFQLDFLGEIAEELNREDAP